MRQITILGLCYDKVVTNCSEIWTCNNFWRTYQDLIPSRCYQLHDSYPQEWNEYYNKVKYVVTRNQFENLNNQRFSSSYNMAELLKMKTF